MKIKTLILALGVLSTPVILDSCNSCTNLAIDSLTISGKGANGEVVSAVPTSISLTAEEQEAIKTGFSTVATALYGNPEDKSTTEKQEGSQAGHDLLGLLGEGMSAIPKAGQTLTVKQKYGTTHLLVQPVYCAFGEIQVGQKGKVVELNGRNVFLPIQ